MVKASNHPLQTRRAYRGQKAALLLAKWLNKLASGHTGKGLMSPMAGQSSVEALLIDAQVVFGRLSKYKSTAEFNKARLEKKIPPAFVKSFNRLNDVLGAFTLAPSIDVQSIYDEGRLVRWSMTDESGLAHVRTQLGWLLRVIEEDAILKIRRCELESCKDWFFAHAKHKIFCKTSHQKKDFSHTDVSRKKQREYMRAYRKD